MPEIARKGRLHPAAWSIIASVAAVVLVAVVLAGVRYGVVSAPGRLFVEARLEGLKIGRFGRLKVQGIGGDVFDDFTVHRLTIADEKGVWLEANTVRVDWNYAALFSRRFHADEISVASLRLLRRPTLTPKTVDKGLPVSFDIDRLKARVEMLPEFSYRRGLFDLSGELDVQRKGGRSGKIAARSLLHEGDFLDLDFALGGSDEIRLVADVNESAGGALAGAVGLPADRRFALTARASGTTGEGTFDLTVLSGDTIPARALGGWNADGGQGAGRIDLSASALTRPLVERLGPQARISVAGRRAKDGTYAIDGKAVSDNLTVTLKGPADLEERRLTPAGLAVAADVVSLERLAGIEGSARLRGVLRGTQDEPAFTGSLGASGLAAGGYRLASLGGPVTLGRRKGEWTLGGELAGAGGQGEGYLGAVLGARPTATVQAARLADGRMLIRRLTARGAGLKVDATGERGLLGGLSFRGDAELSNLAAARPGAKGLLKAGWSASNSDRGWGFTVDARGANFAAGMAELDRLLGASPRLRVKATYGGGRLELAEGRLDGAVASARSAGVMDGGALRFKLDWDARGPFRAGPVEISGDARGGGAITGTLKAPRADLTAAFDAIDLPRLPLTQAEVVLSFLSGEGGTNGLFSLAANSEYGPAVARTAFRFAPGGVELSDLAADAGGVKAGGALSLRRGRPSTADLVVAIGPGALLTEGQAAGTVKITDDAGGTRAVIDLTAKEAAVRGAGGLYVSNAAITADGPLARLPLTIKASGAAGPGPWRIDGGGVLASEGSAYTLTLNGEGRMARANLRTLEPAVLRLDGPERTARLRLSVGREGRAEIDARLDQAGADVTATLDEVALGAFNEDAAGRIDARATLRGRGETLTGALDATLKGARGRGAPQSLSLDGVIKARLADDTLGIDASATNAQGLKSNASVVLPVEASGAPFRLAVATRRPVRGQFAADGEIKPLWDLFVGGERTLSGRVVADGALSGTLADPVIRGQASLAGGAFEDGATGLRLQNLALDAAFAGEAVNVSRVSAADGKGGSLAGAGRISLERDGVSNFRLDLTRFQLIDNDTATATASGQATINRDATGRVQLSGALTIDRADISAEAPTPTGVVSMDVIEINKPSNGERGLQAETSRGVAVALDVTLNAPRRVFVRGRGLDAELSVEAKVTGTTARPDLTGVARLVRGEYEFAGKRFEFDDRGVIHLAADPARIRLDLSATREDPALTAIIRVRGTAARPEITLTSSPALPSDEVLSQVLFGASASQLSPIEAAQLASALASLAGGGGFDVIGGLRGLTRLDRLAFAGGGEGGMTVAGGKYLTDDVYLEIIGGGREGPAAQVEWRVRRSLAIVSRIASQGDARLSVRWRRDY